MCISVLNMPEIYGITYPAVSAEHVLMNHIGGCLTANADWSDVSACTLSAKDPEYSLPLAAICSRFSYFSTVLLHASFVDYDGSGIVFVGPSGIGKTTQAELWQKHLGADIVNGDKAFLRCLDDEVRAYGLPWKGSSSYCLNRDVPVRGIVVLRQAKENHIRRLDGLETMELFMPHVFLPHWDQRCVEQALDTVDRLLCRVPVWLLECRPNRDAVMLTRDTVLR